MRALRWGVPLATVLSVGCASPDTAGTSVPDAPTPVGFATTWSHGVAQGYFEITAMDREDGRLTLSCPTPSAAAEPRGALFIDLPSEADSLPASIRVTSSHPLMLSVTGTRPSAGVRTYVWRAPAAELRRLLVELDGFDGDIELALPALGARRTYSLDRTIPWGEQRAACLPTDI